MMRMLRSRGKRFWTRLLLGAVIGAIGIEVVLRLALGLGTPPLLMTDPEIEYLWVPDQHLYRFGNRIDINSHSMRSSEFPKNRVSDELRVMVLGDSVINGGTPTDQSMLATELLRTQLVKDIHPRRVIVGNISAGSWGPTNLAAYVRKFGLFDADVVFIVLSSHDLTDTPSFEPLDPNSHPTTNPLSATTELISRYLGVHLPKRNVEDNAIHRPDKKGSPRDRTVAALDYLKYAAIDSGAVVRIFIHPEWPEVQSGQYNSAGNQLIQICDQMGIPAVELLPNYLQTRERGSQLYRDYIHPNERGQRALFEAFYCELEDISFASPVDRSTGNNR
jgi:lysophospholipase L1-like esterase